MQTQSSRTGEFRSPRSFVARLWLAVVVLNLVLMGFAAWALLQSRQQFEAATSATVGNLARLMEHDVLATIRLVDLALQTVASEAARRAGGGDAQRLNQLIEQQRAQVPELDGLRLANAEGLMTHGTGVDATSRISIADRGYFQQLRSQPQAGLVIGRPVQGRVSGKWGISLARPVRLADGRFAGVVVGTVPLTYFTAQFLPLQMGAQGSFTLFDADFRLIVRHPEPAGTAAAVGMPFGSGELHQRILGGQTSGTYKATSIVDHVERISSFRQIPGTRLYLVLGMGADDYLAGWYQEAAKAITIVLLFVFLSLGVAWLVQRAWRRQAAALQALEQANRTLEDEKQLNQTMVRSSPFAIYTRDRYGVVTAWNPAAEKLFGWRAEQIVGKPLLTVPAGRERETKALRDRVLAGESLINLEVQRQRKDGTLFDLSTTLAPLRDASGAVTGYLAIASDISERKAAEKRIEFLAYRDVLTGLPNRLPLLDRFSQATHQADRTGSQIALLFLDLDNFKTINDSLGHAVGDALLKEVAQRLLGCVRESDTVSRQGGTSFWWCCRICAAWMPSRPCCSRSATSCSCRSSSTATSSLPRLLSASPSTRTTAAISTPCSRRPTLPCTRPRTPGATATASSTRR